MCKVRSPPLTRPTERVNYTQQAYLKGPLAVTERADVSGRELFDNGLAGELLLHHLACRSDQTACGGTSKGQRGAIRKSTWSTGLRKYIMSTGTRCKYSTPM